MKIQKPVIVTKGWGKEVVFANNKLYCGKLLVFESNKKSSMHFHIIKDETWYIAQGKLKLIWIDPIDGTRNLNILEVGDVIHNIPGYPHQIEAIEDSIIFEVSTEHNENDSYRIEKGHSQL